MRKLSSSSSAVLAALAAFLGIAAASSPSAARPLAALQQDPRQHELEILKPVFDKYYEAGSDYYRSGWRSEALWCFDRATKLMPEADGLSSFASLLRDFDNPAWKRKHWKSPRAGVDAGFQRKQQSYDLAYTQALLRIGAHEQKQAQGKSGLDAALAERAHAAFLDALEIVGGPYELDGSGRIVVGKAGTIPDDVSRRMATEDLVLINGKRWLRDSMLKRLADVSEVHEARSDQCLVRTVTTDEEAKHLLALLDQAYPAYVKELGERHATRPLGLFVFADRKGYEGWCKASGHDLQVKAAGFANSLEGFAVTFTQPRIDGTAVHEAAHLYEFDAYSAAMPSWYDEGVADSFGGGDAMRVTDGKLATFLAPTKQALAPLLRDGRLAPPLDELLHGDATARINGTDGSAPSFYLGSWALYRFFRSTKDGRFAARFDEWESFALGSRTSHGGRESDATKLFDRLFAPVKGDLETAFTEWVNDPR
jgi:hypothetical protein